MYAIVGSANKLAAYVSDDIEDQWMDYWSSEEHIIQRNFLVEFPFEECFRDSAEKYKLPMSLILAVARGESGFNHEAEANAGKKADKNGIIRQRTAIGVMQILWPDTAKDLGFSSQQQLKDPCKNIDAGSYYLRFLLDRYDGNVHLAVAAYNYGPGNIDRFLKSRGDITEGALGYSGYILYNLGKVQASIDDDGKVVTSKPKQEIVKKLLVLKSTDELDIFNFKRMFESRIPGLKLHAFTNSLGFSFLVYNYDGTEKWRKKRLEKDLKLFLATNLKELN